jgi:gp16 family phage-associated protein
MAAAFSGKRPLSPEQIKRQLWLNGSSLKAWAAANGYAYHTVSAVMSGKIKLKRSYGTGYDIALKLGLIVAAESEDNTDIHQERKSQ